MNAINVKFTSHPGSGKSILMKAIRQALLDIGITSSDVHTLGGELVEHEFEVQLTADDMKWLSEDGL